MTAGEHTFLASFPQRRLWFLEQLQPGTSLYNVATAARLLGRLEPAAVQAALETIVGRHESLRTTFLVSGTEPMQVIGPPGRPPLPVVDLERMPVALRRAEAERLAQAMAAEPFDLARGPLFRARLFRLGPEEHLLVLAMHHIVSDGWSLGVLLRELSAFYRAYSTGEPHHQPPLPCQYRDFAAWQHHRLQGPLLARQLGYWRERLAGAPPVLRLPTDRPRPPVQRHRGARRTLLLEPALAQALGTLSRAEGSTLFMTLLSAFGLLLARYSGQRDLVIGTPIAGRTRTELEGLIGFFINTLALRLDLGGRPSFRELLARVREVALGAYGHQELPFERLVEELQPERTLQHHPLFQVLFNHQNAPRGALDLPRVTAEQVRLGRDIAKFDLSLIALERDPEIELVLEYDRDLWTADSVTRLLGHYRTLLSGIASDPSRPVTTLPMMDESERRRVVVEWNRTEATYPVEATVVSLFDERVARAPDAVAVVWEEEEVSYRELDARARRVASALRERGVGPDVPVGVMIGRSLDYLVAILGVIKAGGAYVPLDPAHPPARLRLMLADSGARMLVVAGAEAEGLADLPVLRLEEAVETGVNRPWPANLDPAHLACVLFTSGSTGRPKGVAVTHGNIVNLIRTVDYVSLGPDEVMLHLTHPPFDVSTFEIWGAFLNGARLVVAPAGRFDSREVGELVRRHGVTTMWLTTGLFDLFVDEGLHHLSGVRQLIAGGDVLSPGHVARFVRHLPGCRLLNGYGPSETTTFATTHEVGDTSLQSASIPLGKPIANARAYVLDAELLPVPIGVPGELYIGGTGVTRGYMGRPDLTAARFLPDPFSPVSGSRMYRSGDRARWLEQGVLEFHGRVDLQVKIRGFRVEPEEVEAVLGSYPGVSAAAVVARETNGGGRRLDAYVVPRLRHSAGFADLRAALRAGLPDYMIPANIVVLDELPLTPSGKVDRRALAPPTDQRQGDEGLEPRTELERQLAGIWREVLRRERVGVHDDFFSLGGHSLLATQVIARIRRALEMDDLSVELLFEAPTVAQLAERIAALRPRTQEPVVPPLARVNRSAYRFQDPRSTGHAQPTEQA